MDYFYDVIINMNEDKIFKFYEWENYDAVELIKKIPLYRVSSKTLKDFYLFDILVSKEFLELILDKTILKNNKLNKTLKYACLLCDTKNCLVVEFDSEGQVASRSTLLLEDEADIIEIIYNYKETKFDYQRTELIDFNNNLRQEELVKKVIKLELKTIMDNNNEAKLKYLFNEWFGYEEKNVDKMKKIIISELDRDFNERMYNIYEIIKKSYNNV